MKIIPIFNRVLLEPVSAPKHTQSGIIISQNDEDIKYGKVLESADAVFSIGDLVLFEEHTAYKVMLKGMPKYLIKAIDILAKMEEE
ncbi:MAG: co-chaperone GroES family protein [Christensenellaceae bacterium]|jgi:co-chaperonin GroES (HSP10)|nr:co-chaperone GroES family protein [Christensenellaceae bacterium]